MQSAQRRTRRLKLSGAEAFAIYGFMPKPSIDWPGVLELDTVNLDTLRTAGVSSERLQQMQPSLAVWYTAKKATLRNLVEMQDWRLDVPGDLPDFALLDAVEMARAGASATRMREVGLTLEVLCSRYGLQLQQMMLFPYRLQDWVEMGFVWERHAADMQSALFYMIFNMNMKDGYAQYRAILDRPGTFRDSGERA
jgi:hypothetical protein